MLVVLALVGGCTGGADRPDESVTAVPSLTPTMSPSPSPTPTPMERPVEPAAMSKPTPEGAIAAATHFLALYDYAFSSGDSAPLMAMSADGCEYCTYVRDEVEVMVDGGWTSIADPLQVIDSSSTEIREDEWFRVHLTVEQGPVVAVASDGTRHQTSDGSVRDFIFAISWIGDRWQVQAAGVEDSLS